MLDFVRRFFVSCVQIFEAYAVRLAENQSQKQVQERLREYMMRERSLSWTIRKPELILKLDTNQ